MDEKIGQDIEVSFVEVWMSLKEKSIWIILIMLLSAFLGLLVTLFFMKPKYEASINMIVNVRNDVNGNITVDNINSAQNLADTYAVIIKSNTVLLEVIDHLDLEMSYEELYEQVSVTLIKNTQIIKISVENRNSEEAAKIVEEISKIAPLKVIEAVGAGSCKIVSQIEQKKDPVSPDYKKNTVLAGIAGFLVCLGACVLKELMYDYVVDELDVERKVGISVLGIIPYIKES